MVRSLMLGLALAAAVVAASALTSRASSFPERRGVPLIRNPDYVGHVVGDPQAKVLLQRHHGTQGRQFVSFQPQNLKQICESESERVTYAPIGSEVLARNGRFESVYSDGPADSHQNQEFSLLKGRLLPGGRAKGTFFALVEGHDPPEAGLSGDECMTDGIVRWRAHRVPGGSGAKSPRQEPGAKPLSEGTYRGAILELPPSKGRVAVEISKPQGRTWASFKTRARFYCDAPSRIEKVGPIRIPVRRDGSFDRAFFKQQRTSQDRVFTWVKGQVSANGRARGKFFYFDDPWDPQGAANDPECGTPFVYRWKARLR